VDPLITLTTDFGTRDSYVAQLKGTLLSEGPPGLRLLDLSHELTPFDVTGAAWFLRQAVPRFPAHTVHLVVVDPGVGSARTPLMVRLGQQQLVGPDNGIFGLLYTGREEVFAIDLGSVEGRPLSSTFHGRDLFAPIAARLAAGGRCEDFGRAITHYRRLAWPLPVPGQGGLVGEVVHVDHYGNLITNLAGELVMQLGGREQLAFRIPGAELCGLHDHYAEVAVGEALALLGSSGYVELSVREGSAARALGAQRGTAVLVTKRS
jgi:S-adenosylmethionine hydrolase